MAFIGSAFSNDKGTGFEAQSADVQRPVTPEQAQAAYAQTQAGLGQQQNFVNALNAQNGIGNQSDVYNRLQGIAEGTGPNPALAQLQQQTGTNVANQAALMASQRGAGANAGLMARQAAMQGANTQQQAVGQAATMQAQQQAGAIGAMGNIAGQQVGQQAGAVQGYNQMAQQSQSNLLNSINAQNNAAVSMQGNVNNANASIAGINAQAQQGMVKGGMQAIGGAMPKMGGMAHGGEVPSYADGGDIPPPPGGAAPAMAAPVGPMAPAAPMATIAPEVAPAGPQSSFGQFVVNSAVSGGAPSMGGSPSIPATNFGDYSFGPGGGDEKKDGEGGGGGGMNPMMLAMLARGGPIVGEQYAAQGKMVPGKASINGDSLKNDTVQALLSPGEVIIPRSVMQSKDPVGEAAKFIHAVMAKNGMGRGALKEKGKSRK